MSKHAHDAASPAPPVERDPEVEVSAQTPGDETPAPPEADVAPQAVAEEPLPHEEALKGWTSQQGGGPVGREFVPTQDYVGSPPARVEFASEADESY